jgi:Fic family protein
MHVEIRKKGKAKLYYLAHSFRDNGKVRKVRRYLGKDLTHKKLESLKENAGKAILEQIGFYKSIRDPLHTVLSPTEKESIKSLIAEGEVEVIHLSEKDWGTFVENFTYDTNAIEGSALSLPEVRNIIRKNKWPKHGSKEDISEAYGVAEAVAFIRKTKEHISLDFIKELHRIVFNNSKTFAGKLREKSMEVVVADSSGRVLHRGAPQRKVVSLLKELIDWYGKNKKKYHPIVLAAVVHNQFENIHPFQDGNGRVGRLLLNNILLKHSLPPVNIEFKKRGDYYSSLRAYQRAGNIRPTIELILKEYKELRRM